MSRNYARLLGAALLLATTALVSGCSGEAPDSNGATDGSVPAAAAMARSPAPPGATVFIFSPENGATLSSPVQVKFGVSGIAIAPAGQMQANAGHHHLLIDTALQNPDQPLPKDAGHIHYGKGQTEALVELEPGQHTLQLVLGDGNHVPHDPPIVSRIVTITVE
jgi:hypothetical protein